MSETVIDMRSQANKEWMSTMIDLSKPIAPPEPLLIQEESGIPLLFRRGIHIVSGKKKAGKTFYNSVIMSSLLNPNGYCGFRPTKTTFKILFADTEQDKSDTQEVVKRVHRLNGWTTEENQSRLIGISLRDQSIEKRLQYIEDAMRDMNPDILIIDGIVDLCIDFNSLDESHKLTTLLMKWTVQYDVSIITALHINKGNDELRGHLGSFLGQKGDSIMRITKENDGMLYISCKITDSRHKPIDDFNFRIVEGIPEPYEVDLSKKAQVNYQDIFENVLSTPLKYCDLATEVAKTTNKAISTANRYIKTATELGIIKNNDGYYVCDSTLPF